MLILLGLLAVSLASVHGETCQTIGKGKMFTFSNDKAFISVPCKYHMTESICQGYKIKVSPGQALDRRGRYFTDTIWVAISKEENGKEYIWSARSSTKLIKRFFVKQEIEKPYSVKDDDMKGASYSIDVSTDVSDYSVHFGVSSADFEVIFYGYDAKDKDKRKANGVEIRCPELEYLPETHYPDSLCGNLTSKNAIRQRKRKLGVNSKTKAVLFDMMLSDDVAQTNPQCDLAGSIFRGCKEDQAETIEACADIVLNKKLISCLVEYKSDPMDLFIHCLRFKCSGNKKSCDLLKDGVDGCPDIKALSGGC